MRLSCLSFIVLMRKQWQQVTDALGGEIEMRQTTPTPGVLLGVKNKLGYDMT